MYKFKHHCLAANGFGSPLSCFVFGVARGRAVATTLCAPQEPARPRLLAPVLLGVGRAPPCLVACRAAAAARSLSETERVRS